MMHHVLPSHAAELAQAFRAGGAQAGLRKLIEVTEAPARIAQNWRRAAWFALLHDTEGTLSELEKAYQVRNFNMMYLVVDPIHDRVRAHPRFKKIAADMGLTTEWSMRDTTPR